MSLWRKILGIEETKDIQPWYAGFSDRDNFVTNRVTVAAYNDAPMTDFGLAATWSCVNLIAGTIGSMSLEVFRPVNGILTAAKDHALYRILHDAPNYDLTSLDFWEYQAAAIELYGNAFALIQRGVGGNVIGLDILTPKMVGIRRVGVRLVYTYEGKDYDERDILHIRGPFATATGGVSVLSACGAVFSGARAADSAASSMFGRGAMPSGVLSSDKVFNREQREQAEKMLVDKFVGAHNAGRPMLLDNGVKWEQLSISPEDAQMLESRKFSGEEICRIFGVPPAMVGYGDKASNWGTGKEVDVLGFQKFTLRRRVKRIEKALEQQLLTSDERLAGYKIGFNFEDLLRMDSEARARFYNTLIRLGVMTRNEARKLEGLPPVEGGDMVTVQMQDVPLSSVGDSDNENEI